jgi:hypothetical protein
MLPSPRVALSLWLRMQCAAGLALLFSCGEQHEPRPSPIVARRLGGDSVAPGAMVKICTPEDEACVPTYAVACSTTWAGDRAEKPHLPQLSREEQAWCAAYASADSNSR